VCIVIGSDFFRGLADGLRTASGAPWLPLVSVPHPLGGVSVEGVHAKAAGAWTAVADVIRDLSESAERGNR
jgi:hypothetical protein